MKFKNTVNSLTLVSLASSAQAVVITETFDAGLDPSLWDAKPISENSGLITPVNDRLEFTAGPAASLTGSNHYGTYNASSALSGDDDWCVDVTAFLAPVSDFGTFDLNEAVGLTLSIENTNNSQENLQVTFAVGDPFGTGTSDKQVRVGFEEEGEEEVQVLSGLLGGIGATDLKLVHDASTNEISITFDDGGGPLLLATQVISGWDLDTEKNLTLSLGGGAFSTDESIMSGTFEVQNGEAYFDNLVIDCKTIPEPSTLLLGGLGLLSLLRRRR